ncbi:MAG: ROK family protein [Planctomycetaceae bacterium]|nr:ROK family protein [Planctomycetaceae bacterium]
MSYCIGIDVGGTTSTIAIGNSERVVLDVSDQFATRTVEGPEATIASIASEITAGLARIGVSPDQLTDVGLATPGPATLDGVLLNSPNFNPQLWNNVPFRANLETTIRETSPSASVHYIGDGQAAALGEFSIRGGTVTWSRVPVKDARTAELSSLFMLVVGTGLGGGEVRDSRVVRGKEGRAGHAGHIFLPAYAFRYEHDRQLLVGNAKCTVESAVSLTALTHQLGYRLTLEQWSDHPLNLAAGSTRDKAKQLRGFAAQGDPLALELFKDQARAIGIGLLSVNYVGDYDLLVVGGGVCDLAPAVREQYRLTAEQAYREFALDGFRNLDRIEFSACGDEAPVIGALANAYLNAVTR